jgi:hypothetical protein
MLSPGLRQVLESLPSRIPLAVEVFDCALNVVAPDPIGRSHAMLDAAGELRAQLMASMTSGRPQTAVNRGRRTSVFPMSAAGERRCTALLAIAADESETSLIDAWAPLLRGALEADLSSVATTTQQLQQAKHLGAVLRFVQHLSDTAVEPEILRATIQAAAVWFDLDARIYRRTRTGGFVPYMYLPGAPIVSHRSIPALTIDSIRDALRISSVADLEALGLTGEAAVVLPIGGPLPDLALVLAGSPPADIELTFGAITRVAAQLLHRARTHMASTVCTALIDVLSNPSFRPEQTLTRALTILLERCGASSGLVSASGREEPRVLALVGHAVPSLVPVADGEVHVTIEGDRMAVTVPAGRNLSITIELQQDALRAEFDPTSQHAFERAVEMLQAWLLGLSATPEGRRALLGLPPEEPSGFLSRIEQEIARAKRFNLSLALVVVRGRNPLDDPARLDEMLRSVRAELRDSDVLGAMNPGEVAALLIQTDSQGGEAVVRRLHRRLADDETSPVGLSSVGHAVLSAQCPTAAELLSRARAAEGRAMAAMGPGKD